MPTSIPTTVFPSAPCGWTGPHENLFLRGYANGATKLGEAQRYVSFEDVVREADKMGDKCGGITLEFNIKKKRFEYTLRRGLHGNLKHSDKSQHLSVASWVKGSKEQKQVEHDTNVIETSTPPEKPYLYPPSFFEKNRDASPIEVEDGEIITFTGLETRNGMFMYDDHHNVYECNWGAPIGKFIGDCVVFD